jgi:hypothetical protein
MVESAVCVVAADQKVLDELPKREAESVSSREEVMMQGQQVPVGGEAQSKHDEEGASLKASTSILGKRTRMTGSTREQTSQVHALIQACATAFAGMHMPIKQMMGNTLLLAPVLDALDNLTQEDVGVCLNDVDSTRAEAIEIFAGKNPPFFMYFSSSVQRTACSPST